MSHVLAKMLGKPAVELTHWLREFEHATGHRSRDVRVIAEQAAQRRVLVAQLGLDPNDTTNRELYAALVSHAKQHDIELARASGVARHDNPSKLVGPVTAFVANKVGDRTVWSIRPAALKRMLRQNPPTKTLKKLGYKSLPSMLKREPVHQIYAGLHMCEDAKWWDAFYATFSKLAVKDFEHKPATIIALTDKRFAQLAPAYAHKNAVPMIVRPEVGLVATLPIQSTRIEGYALLIATQILHAISEVACHSAYFRQCQVQHNFGQAVAEFVQDSEQAHSDARGMGLPWRHTHYNMTNASSASPHLQAEDMAWVDASSLLARLLSDAGVWQHTQRLVVADSGGVVSANAIDIALSVVNGSAFEHASTRYGQQALWLHVISSYASNGLELQTPDEAQDFAADIALEFA